MPEAYLRKGLHAKHAPGLDPGVMLEEERTKNLFWFCRLLFVVASVFLKRKESSPIEKEGSRSELLIV